MHSRPILKDVELSLSSVSRQVFGVIGEIRPDWNESNTRLVTFTEGITNAILGLFDTRAGNDRSTGLIIKLFGAQTELFIDRQAEVDAMIKLSECGVLSQHILVQFKNGIIYEFTTGEACSREQVRAENVAKLIAVQLARLHSAPVENRDTPGVVLLLRRFIELLGQSEPTEEVSEMKADVDFIEEQVLPVLVPDAQLGKDLVCCHNDLLVKNIIYNAKNETVSFIDFEYTRLNYYLFDIANHFVEYAGVDDADFSLYPARDEQKRWLQHYFTARQMNDRPVDDDLCHLIDRFSALAHLMWGLWALVQSRVSLIEFDYVSYAKVRLDCYRKLRPILFGNIRR